MWIFIKDIAFNANRKPPFHLYIILYQKNEYSTYTILSTNKYDFRIINEKCDI